LETNLGNIWWLSN